MKQTKSFHLEINENSTYLSQRLYEYSLYYFYFATSCKLGIISKYNIKKKKTYNTSLARMGKLGAQYTIGGSINWYNHLDSLSVSTEGERWPSDFTSRYIPKSKACIHIPRDMHKNVHSSPICKSKKLVTT